LPISFGAVLQGGTAGQNLVKSDNNRRLFTSFFTGDRPLDGGFRYHVRNGKPAEQTASDCFPSSKLLAGKNMSVVDVTREDWVQETERLCPSSLAFNAYVDLEEMIVSETDLDVTYKRVPRGKSSYCTFQANAGTQLHVIQIYKGQCQLHMRVNPKLTGMNDEERETLLAAYEEFRTELNGTEGKGWETTKVIRTGEEKVHEAIQKLAASLTEVVKNADPAPAKKKRKAAAKKVEAEAEVETEEATTEA